MNGESVWHWLEKVARAYLTRKKNQGFLHNARCEATAPGDGNSSSVMDIGWQKLFNHFCSWLLTHDKYLAQLNHFWIWWKAASKIDLTHQLVAVCKFANTLLFEDPIIFSRHILLYISYLWYVFISYHIIPILGAALCGQDAVPMRPIHNPALLGGGRGETENLCGRV